MKTFIIGISGKQHAGKTTLAEALAARFSNRATAVVTLKFAQPLYDLSAAFNRILGVESKVKDGKLMQLVGNHARSTYGEDIFLKAWKQSARLWLDSLIRTPARFILCDDLRYENEADGIRALAQELGARPLLIRLNCSEQVRQARCPATWRDDVNHPSEVGLDGFQGFDLNFDTERWPTARIADCIESVMIPHFAAIAVDEQQKKSTPET